MAITSETLFSLVLADHLSVFPQSSAVVRRNPETGMPAHNPATELVRALCAGLVNAVKNLVVQDLGSGTSDVTGIPAPANFSFPGTAAAVSTFINSKGWNGPLTNKAVGSLVQAPLDRLTGIGLIQMIPNPGLGTGQGVVSPAVNPDLAAKALLQLRATLPAAVLANGHFGSGDVFGAPINAQLASHLDGIAQAWATALGSVVAIVTYTGTGGGSPVSGIVNTGAFI